MLGYIETKGKAREFQCSRLFPSLPDMKQSCIYFDYFPRTDRKRNTN